MHFEIRAEAIRVARHRILVQSGSPKYANFRALRFLLPSRTGIAVLAALNRSLPRGEMDQRRAVDASFDPHLHDRVIARPFASFNAPSNGSMTMIGRRAASPWKRRRMAVSLSLQGLPLF